MLPHPIINIAEICAQKNVREIILSPGSRCAPLTLAFVRHPKINTRTISDERSAAFIALGIAQQTRRPVGLVSTSGTATLNYSPAIAEAFYQNIPLLIFTADRPPEWIDQQDGQTIHQRNIHEKHCKASYELPVDHSHHDAVWQIERTISEAINISNTYPEGPVHINVPVREPFFPEKNEFINYDKNVKIIHQTGSEKHLSKEVWRELLKNINSLGKKLIVAGLQYPNAGLITTLNEFQQKTKIPIITDVNSNLHGIDNAITHCDVILAAKNDEILKNITPDLLISFGDHFISKNLKLFLRKYQPKQHWHIQPAGNAADTFKSLTHTINVTPQYFFSELNKYNIQNPIANNKYYNLWQKQENKAQDILKHFFSDKKFSEFQAVSNIIENLPEKCVLHLGNSMPVRYVSILGLSAKQRDIEVFSNRGTGGIDGTISAAVGAALVTDKITIALTGDMAFIYDRNALWNNYLPANLRIIILNNHGGGIFGVIDGPDKLPELDEYFITKQKLTAENIADDYDLEYFRCQNNENLLEQAHFPEFFANYGKAKILEIECDILTDRQVFNEFKKICQ